MQRKLLKVSQGNVVDVSSALIANGKKLTEDEIEPQSQVIQVVEQENMESKKQGHAYIAEGNSWDDTDDEDDVEEYRNFALMALEQGKSSVSKSEVPILTTIDLNATQYKKIVEKMSVEMFHIHTSMVAATEEVNAPLFKACEVKFSEVELIIKQEIANEDEEKKNAKSSLNIECEKEPKVSPIAKTLVNEIKNKSTGK
ncbi:hypothetical protein AgCh_004481 [Apium graveolens]